MFRLFAALGFATLMLGACNTVQGAGKDLSAAGQVVTESAAEVQDRI